MKGFFFITLLLLAIPAFSQEVPASTEQQLENLGDENLDDDALLQQLVFYRKNPLDLNTATAEDLYPLRFLSELQIQNLIRYRSAFGKLISIYELQAVPGFDLLTIRKILPYVFVSDSQTVNEAFSSRLHGGSQTALFRISRVLEKEKGYDTTLKTHYLGDPNHLLLRYTYQYKNLLYYGLTADKDAGEQFFKGAQKAGFDFYSAHFFVRNLGKIKALALGDYTLNLGQGLTQWQSLAFGKSAEVMAIKRQAPVILPYRSAGEFYFNRGAAITLQLGRWQLTPFLSYKKFSGNLAFDSIERFTSFGTSGYYRTRLEVEDRYKLSDFSTGGSLSYVSTGFKLSGNAVMHRFSSPLQKSNEPYNRFALSGEDLFLASIDYSYTFKNMHLFGELASDRQFHHAFVQGALVSIDPKIDLSLFYRAIQKEYQAPFGNAFTENTLPTNEEGFYTGIQMRPTTGWQVAAYADFYHFPFIKYRISSPSRGCDYLTEISYAPDKRTEIYVRYRSETKPLNGVEMGQTIQFPFDQVKQNLRLDFSTQFNRQLSLRGRTEITWFANQSDREEGFLVYTETAFAPSAKWNSNLRLQYFETGGYDSRIYAYESDVLYGFSIPAFFDKGFRYYLNMSCNLGKRLTLWLRFAQTVYQKKTSLGSGLDEINGNRKSEMKWQLRYQF
jgi:hypothetical protein